MSKLGYLATGLALGFASAVGLGYYVEQTEGSYDTSSANNDEAVETTSEELVENVSADENDDTSSYEQINHFPPDASDTIKVL